jgi:tRNA 5-methylaminomethyl-2-thiouridine biosynthesis bifunctional protein
MSEALDWTGPGPRSPRFDDIYFSPEDGLAETRAVFLAGCGLPEAWAGRGRFVVAELGFGTGLNVLALADLWRKARPAPGAVLHVFSVEAYPLARADAARALAAWPDLADLADDLLRQWPGGRRGFHRIEWPDAGVILDLAVMEAAAALHAWTGAADAWFLDGFAPSKNPQMWRPEVMSLIAARSAPDARVATFSVAGAVRRGLEAAGFAVRKAPGYGGKKQRLEGRLTGPAQKMPTPTPAQGGMPTVAIVGVGVAGASLARAFRRLGVRPVLVEAEGVGAGASGNAAALVTPRLDAGLGAVAELHAQAFARAVQLYKAETPGAIIAEGALQLETQPRDGARFDKIAAWDGFDPGALARQDAVETALALGEAPSPPSLRLRDALVLEPAAVLAAWIEAPPLKVEVASLARTDDRWRLQDGGGATVAEADIVCLAAGPFAARLAAGLPLRPVRGQASVAEDEPFFGAAAAWGAYAIPTRTGVLFGATHGRGDASTDLRPEDDARNRRDLAVGRPALAARLADAPLTARAALRAATPDHMPLMGAVPGAPEGLFVLSGLGGRGFTLAPLLGEALAALALGAPGPLPRALLARLDPARFLSLAAQASKVRPTPRDASASQ